MFGEIKKGKHIMINVSIPCVRAFIRRYSLHAGVGLIADFRISVNDSEGVLSSEGTVLSSVNKSQC